MSPREGSVVIVLLAMFVTIGWVIYLAADTTKRHRRMKVQAELHGRLLEKFGSAREIVEFFQTAGGAQLIENISRDPQDAAGGVLRSTHRGIVTIALGIGCLALHWHYGSSNDNPLLVVGAILLSLGVGFLISAAVSYRLTKALDTREQAAGNQR